MSSTYQHMSNFHKTILLLGFHVHIKSTQRLVLCLCWQDV